MLDDATRYRLMKILKDNPDISQRELAQELGISLGKVNYCLRAVIERGWVKVLNFGSSRNKKGYMYVLTPKGLEEKARVTARFLRRKIAEYDLLQREIHLLRQEVE